MNERELFLSALEIKDPEARKAHLQSVCTGDDSLLARVESLLASHENHSQFLATPVMEQLGGSLAGGTAAANVIGNGSTEDEGSAAAADSRVPNPLTPHQEHPADEIPLGYLEPSTRPDSLGRLAHYEVLEVLGKGPSARCSRRSTRSCSGWWRSR